MKTPKSISISKLTLRSLITAILGLSLSVPGLAQESSRDHTVVGLHVYVPVEYHSIDPGELNRFMGVADLPQVRVPRVFTGIGTQIQVDRIVLNGSIAAGGKRYDVENAKMSAPFTTYGFTLGYDLLKCPFMNLQPYAGIRVARMAYKCKLESEGPDQTYRQHDEMQFRGNRGMIDLGIGASLQKAYLLGLRGGVLIPAGRTRWESGDGSKLTGGPELRYRYYIGVSLGLGRANIKIKNAPAVKSSESEESVSFVY